METIGSKNGHNLRNFDSDKQRLQRIDCKVTGLGYQTLRYALISTLPQAGSLATSVVNP
jgi:hypothetical protein